MKKSRKITIFSLAILAGALLAICFGKCANSYYFNALPKGLVAQGGNFALLIGGNYDRATLCGENDVSSFSRILKEKYKFSQSQIDTMVFRNKYRDYHDMIIDKLNEYAGQNFNMLIIYYSGHGSQLENVPANDVEEDGLDEYIDLGNTRILDDELHDIWLKFNPATKIIFITDCCHSASIHTVAKMSAGNFSLADSEINLLHIASVQDDNVSLCSNPKECSDFSKVFFSIIEDNQDLTYKAFCEGIPYFYSTAACNCLTVDACNINFWDQKIFQ